jgi:hypothetical protein
VGISTYSMRQPERATYRYRASFGGASRTWTSLRNFAGPTTKTLMKESITRAAGGVNGKEFGAQRTHSSIDCKTTSTGRQRTTSTRASPAKGLLPRVQ